MPRSLNLVASRRRRKKILNQAKGYWGKRKNVYTIAKNAVEKGLQYQYRDRKKPQTCIPKIMDSSYKCRS